MRKKLFRDRLLGGPLSAIGLAVSVALTAGSARAMVHATYPSEIVQNIEVNAYDGALLKKYWQIYPDFALYMGVGDYQHIQPIESSAEIGLRLTALKTLKQTVVGMRYQDKSVDARTDGLMFEKIIDADIWYYEQYRQHEWDASYYGIADPISVLFEKGEKYKAEGKADALDRLGHDLLSRLLVVPGYYATAKVNLSRPSKMHTDLAISQQAGTVAYLREDVQSFVNDAGFSESTVMSLTRAIEDAAVTVERFNEHLKGMSHKGDGVYRLGREQYTQKYKFDLGGVNTPEKTYRQAHEDIEVVHSKMYALATQMWPKYFPDQPMPAVKRQAVEQMLEKLRDNHVPISEFFPRMKENIKELEAFVKEKDLLTIDMSKPLVVQQAPDYQMGYAGAYVIVPGPFDPTSNTYYNVSGFTEESEKSIRRMRNSFNHWSMQVLNIHEAVPGHYTQIARSNESDSVIKAVFANDAMVEGWAVYAERMMLEEGYGGDTPEMWFMYYRWFLSVAVNMVIDYDVHVKQVAKADAMDWLMDRGLMTKTQAKKKWRRAGLTQVQLSSYYVGFKEIYQFREDLKESTAEKFDLKEFHDQFLSYGSAPVSVIRDLMFDDYVQRQTGRLH